MTGDGLHGRDVTDDAFYEWLLSDHPDARAERDQRRAATHQAETGRAAAVRAWVDKISAQPRRTPDPAGPGRHHGPAGRPDPARAEARYAEPDDAYVTRLRAQHETHLQVSGPPGSWDYRYPAHLTGPGAAAYPPPPEPDVPTRTGGRRMTPKATPRLSARRDLTEPWSSATARFSRGPRSRPDRSGLRPGCARLLDRPDTVRADAREAAAQAEADIGPRPTPTAGRHGRNRGNPNQARTRGRLGGRAGDATASGTGPTSSRPGPGGRAVIGRHHHPPVPTGPQLGLPGHDCEPGPSPPARTRKAPAGERHQHPPRPRPVRHRPQADGEARMFITNVRRLAGRERPPGAVLIAAATWLLALLDAGLLYVSFDAQSPYIFAPSRTPRPAMIEAAMLDAA